MRLKPNRRSENRRVDFHEAAIGDSAQINFPREKEEAPASTVAYSRPTAKAENAGTEENWGAGLTFLHDGVSNPSASERITVGSERQIVVLIFERGREVVEARGHGTALRAGASH